MRLFAIFHIAVTLDFVIATYIQLYWRHSHDSRETFARVSHDSRETFARASHECETFAPVSHDSREIFVRASHDSRETFVRVSHDVRANFIQFFFLEIKSRNGLIYVAYLSHCADRGNSFAMCLRTSAKDWRRVRDICDDLATVLR